MIKFNNKLWGKKIFFTILIFSCGIEAKANEKSFGPMISALANWSTVHHPAFGASIKYAALPKKEFAYFSLSAELIYQYSFNSNLHSIEIAAFSFLGLFAPGIALQYEYQKVTTFLMLELDLFLFPFAFVSIMLFEKPKLIPSVYFRLKSDFQETHGSIGLRFSLPFYKNL